MISFLSHRAATLAAAVTILTLPSLGRAADFETPPVLRAKDAAPAALRSGKGFRVDPRVPTNGLTTVFAIESDSGTFQALGVQTLALRESEISAIFQLDHDGKVETFVKAVRSTAIHPLESAAQMITNPVQTVQGLPGGLDRFFDRVETGAQEIGTAAANLNADVSASGQQLAEMSGGVAANALGYNLELRQLAKQLGVDPYTSNPVLEKKLHEFARVAFTAYVATNTLISIAVPASITITGTNVTRDLIYDTPSGDLVAQNLAALQTLGASDDTIQAFQQAPGFTLSLRTNLVAGLQQLPGATGATDVVKLATGALTADLALFLVRALRMQGQYQTQVAPISSLTARGTIVATDMNGALVLPAPVDYVSWTERVAGFAQRPDLAAPQRGVWITGRMTPRSKAGLQALGWTVREHAGEQP